MMRDVLSPALIRNRAENQLFSDLGRGICQITAVERFVGILNSYYTIAAWSREELDAELKLNENDIFWSTKWLDPREYFTLIDSEPKLMEIFEKGKRLENFNIVQEVLNKKEKEEQLPLVDVITGIMKWYPRNETTIKMIESGSYQFAEHFYMEKIAEYENIIHEIRQKRLIWLVQNNKE